MFWHAETSYDSVEEFCEDLRERRLVSVTQLITEHGSGSTSVIVDRRDLAIHVDSVYCIEVPRGHFLEGRRGT